MTDTHRRSARLNNARASTMQSHEVESGALSIGSTAKSAVAKSVDVDFNSDCEEISPEAEDSDLSDDYGSSSEDQTNLKRKRKAKTTNRPAKRTKRAHITSKQTRQSAGGLAFFERRKEQKEKMKGFPLTSLPLDAVFEVRLSQYYGYPAL
jgi:hypothetical protein